jgi:flagellar FliL protein
MADDEKTGTSVDETEPKTETKGDLPLKKYGIYAGIVLIMIFAAYFITLKVIKPMFAGGKKGTEVVEATKEGHGESEGEEESEGHGSTPTERSESGHESEGFSSTTAAGDIYLIKEIIVNPAGTGGTRFLSASIGFELESDKVGELFSEREAIVRDALITILSSQSIPELSDFKRRERLRKLIQLRVQKLLHSDEIAAVYFTEFVLQ